MFEYLDDMDFLIALDKCNIKIHYVKLVLLTFDTEKPIKEIQGIATGGSINVNTSSAVRRTMSLSMYATSQTAQIDNLRNDIAIDKKVKIFVGYQNPFMATEYKKYGEIIWFPCGVFILSSANISRSTSGWSISISGKDKIAMLDGTAGGTLPASTTFHERYIMDDYIYPNQTGDITIEYPTIRQIIFEAVNHWGGEAAENIIISDLDDQVKMLVKYNGDKPIYFSHNFESLSYNPSPDYENAYTYGQDVGYKYTDFTYPGELILNAGDTVVTLLNKIIDVLGNYEFFYTIDGKFVFQQIKNYLNIQSPLENLLELTRDDYVKNYNNAKYLYSLTDLDTTTQITMNPKYDNIKNDFYVWGKRKTVTDTEVDIRYHLAIDTKPRIDLAAQYMWEVKDTATDLIVRYDFNNRSTYSVPGYKTTCVGIPCAEWREELYRLALNAQVTNSVHDSYYDSELIAEWRGLYDPMNTAWASRGGWNPDIYENPGNINFWLDFIDTDSSLGEYSVRKIGRRTKVVNNSDLRSVFNREVPDIIFLEGYDPSQIAHYTNIGQRYFLLTEEYYDLFTISSTGASCFDKIRELMYQNLSYNTTISLTCLPKYYMEPNNIIHVEDKASGINGNYLITQFSLPLAYNGTMSISATEVLTRV